MSNIYNYYVYAYLRENDGSPYYIGKGKDDRAYSSQHSINIPKNKSMIVFLEKNLSNIGALALERRYIRWYGRKDIGTGILRNLTEGGDGNTGKRSKKWVDMIKNLDRSYMKTQTYRIKAKLGSDSFFNSPAGKQYVLSLKVKSSYIRTRESIKKFSNSMKGKIMPLHVKEALRTANKKAIRTKEWRLKQSLNNGSKIKFCCINCKRIVNASAFTRFHQHSIVTR